MPAPALPAYVITRHGVAPPRLFEVTGPGPTPRRWQGRDVMTGRRQTIRADAVIARHGDLLMAAEALDAARAAAAEDDRLRRARLDYLAARRQHDYAVARAASGRVTA